MPAPLADVADRWLAALPVAGLDGATLLGERAALAGLRARGRVSAGGGCRLYDAAGGVAVALNLARAEDRAMLPALFETEDVTDLDASMAESDADAIVARGRAMGLAIAHEAERSPPALVVIAASAPAPPPARAPKVVDLSALWAGPLAARLLGMAGADVLRIESRGRPDAMRRGRDAALAVRLEEGKRRVLLDPARDRDALAAHLAVADIVIEASRPRALEQLGIDAGAIVAATPGLVWMTITGHGARGEAAHWVAFGDDAGVAGGLTAALRRATGRVGFVGDAIADPLTGIRAAAEAWTRWRAGHGGRIALAMSGVAGEALAATRGGLASC